jgi:hypothetical protein
MAIYQMKTFLPLSSVAQEIDAGHLVALTIDGLPTLTRCTSLIYHKNRYPSIGMRAFIVVTDPFIVGIVQTQITDDAGGYARTPNE